MASQLGKIIKGDRHPSWLVDAIILSAAVYGKDPQEELLAMDKEYGLPATARYEFGPDEELRAAGFEGCKQTLLVVKSLTGGHYVVACRGTTDMSDALADLNIVHRTLSLGDGAAHAGFLDRAKSIPLEYFRRLLIRNEKLVLTGHSLGGAVASLLTLRLLESTGRWCHQQVQCYTFGCPFFADYRLANHINSRYKQHFVHMVSRTDFVPKVMPVAYTVYCLWAGLHVGPLEDFFHFSRTLMVALQLTKTRLKLTEKIRLFTVASQALAWLPALSRVVLHRLLALALSHHSGYGYAFAGQMMLLGAHETSAFELADREKWTMNKHLSFHLGSGVSFKEHSLLSYIDRIFAVQVEEQASASTANSKADTISGATPSCAPTVKVHMATINLKLYYNRVEESREEVKPKCIIEDEDEDDDERDLWSNRRRSRRKARSLKSQVACVIFARRLQEASPKSFKLQQQMSRKSRNAGFVRVVVHNLARVSRFVHRFDRLLLASSLVCAGMQLHKLLSRT